ncbi:YTH domain-containing protein ECT3-like [Salvia miltiorrhiza]|uniref:YTH domain-containing protein ECT3-like n=1 Tax=Salvia miltiorrhiza TaxID=226208 RepID=UPI0025AD275B|nr:YTH domain-containing protein ECT3-like [Salvia miltiorrhiza]
MTGPVDFHRDVDFDFRLRDKRSGSFPVKWHIIKDLANLKNFRFTILHTNENMPGTDKRDIQRLSYKKGLRMHNIFKRRTSTTSLLDFMQEEGEGRLQKQ